MYKKASDNDLILNEDGDLYAADPETEADGVVAPATPADDPLALGDDEEENTF
jgi:hypothetical protein